MQTFLTAPERALRRRREPVRLVPKPECAKGKAGGAGPGAPWAPLLAARLPVGLSQQFPSRLGSALFSTQQVK